MVSVNPIRTEEDYDAALTRLSEIFQAEIGTPEGDERDILVDLIECYEDRHHPIGPPTDPIASIEFEMDQRGLTLHDLAPLHRRLGQGHGSHVPTRGHHHAYGQGAAQASGHRRRDAASRTTRRLRPTGLIWP